LAVALPAHLDRLASLQVNIAESLAVTIREGMGIGVLPVYAAIEGLRNGTLVRVLPQHKLQKTNVYALYPSRKFVDAKTKTWVEFLRAHLPQVIERDLALLEELTQEQLTDEAEGAALGKDASIAAAGQKAAS
jgi:DNA-binding transcriptional LysR family regulator